MSTTNRLHQRIVGLRLQCSHIDRARVGHPKNDRVGPQLTPLPSARAVPTGRSDKTWPRRPAAAARESLTISANGLRIDASRLHCGHVRDRLSYVVTNVI